MRHPHPIPERSPRVAFQDLFFHFALCFHILSMYCGLGWPKTLCLFPKPRAQKQTCICLQLVYRVFEIICHYLDRTWQVSTEQARKRESKKARNQEEEEEEEGQEEGQQEEEKRKRRSSGNCRRTREGRRSIVKREQMEEVEAFA